METLERVGGGLIISIVLSLAAVLTDNIILIFLSPIVLGVSVLETEWKWRIVAFIVYIILSGAAMLLHSLIAKSLAAFGILFLIYGFPILAALYLITIVIGSYVREKLY